MNSTRELLLGYLLGSLEQEEIRSVECELELSAELREQLALLAASMAPLGFPHRDDPYDLDGPPRGLAERAVEFVEDTERDLSIQQKPARLSPASPAETAQPARRLSWADFIVAASVLLAAGAMLFPAIMSSRRNAQIMACQNNLRELGIALQQFSDNSRDHRIPAVPMRGNRSVAGIYSAMLKDAHLLPSDSLVLCPASNRQTLASNETFAIPSLSQIDKAVGETLLKIQRSLGGNYAYSLGFVDNGKHRAATMPGRTHYAVMSDAPAATYESPRKKFRNHGGRGQNMLYEDNRVQYVVDLDNDLLDDPYLNRSGMIAAGEDRDDIVLGESFARPMPSLFQTTNFEVER